MSDELVAGVILLGVLACLAVLIRRSLVPEGARTVGRARCWYRGRHEPRRTLLGGQRCRDCGATGADLEEMGFVGGGYVPHLRRLYDRDLGTFTRTSAWEPNREGRW